VALGFRVGVRCVRLKTKGFIKTNSSGRIGGLQRDGWPEGQTKGFIKPRVEDSIKPVALGFRVGGRRDGYKGGV